MTGAKSSLTDPTSLYGKGVRASPEMANPSEWVNGIDTETFFWKDGHGTTERGLRLLREWGVSSGAAQTGRASSQGARS